MPSSTSSPWQRAQHIERQFWDTYDGRNEHYQRWLLGVLGISFGFTVKSVIDLGGGPRSVLLKIPRSVIERASIIDPLQLSFKEQAAYRAIGVHYYRAKAEQVRDTRFHPELAGIGAEEVWLYNVLQHVENIQETLFAAQLLAQRTIRIVEWLHEPIEPHHLHSLTPTDLMLPKPWYTTQEVMGTFITDEFEKHFLASVWTRR